MIVFIGMWVFIYIFISGLLMLGVGLWFKIWRRGSNIFKGFEIVKRVVRRRGRKVSVVVVW